MCRPVALPLITVLVLAASIDPVVGQGDVVAELFGFLVLLTLLLGAYLVPSIVAFARKHPDRCAILVVNLVFGVTGLGWLGSLIWALLAVSRPIGGGSGGVSILTLAGDPRASHDPFPPTSPYADLARRKELLDRGAVGQSEYERLKQKLLFGPVR